MIELRKVVYIMAPMTIYKCEKKYWYPINNLKKQFLNVRFILPHNSFISNEDWRQNINKYINKVDFGILLSDNEIIGKGCYTEIEKLTQQKKLIYYYNNQELTERFSICKLPGENWKRYAKVILG